MFRLETTESSSARGSLAVFAEDTGLTLRTRAAPHNCLQLQLGLGHLIASESIIHAHGTHMHMYAGKRLMHIKLKINLLKKNYKVRSLSGSSRNHHTDGLKRF